MVVTNALGIIGIGFLFTIGALMAWVLLQIGFYFLQRIAMRQVLNKLYKPKEKSKPPKGMEFGKF